MMEVFQHFELEPSLESHCVGTAVYVDVASSKSFSPCFRFKFSQAGNGEDLAEGNVLSGHCSNWHARRR